jgi:hypothetical protein
MSDALHAQRVPDDHASDQAKATNSSTSKSVQNPADPTGLPLWTKAWGNQPPPGLMLPVASPVTPSVQPLQQQHIDDSHTDYTDTQLTSETANSGPTQHEEELTVQRTASHPLQKKDTSLGTRIQAAKGTGYSLEGGIQHTLERRLGADLSGVHIHTDSEANALAHSVDAVAFTTGTDIFFSSGTYNPSTLEGKHLLAHEAIHVVQQATGSVAGTPTDGGVSISNPNDSFEQAAETSAQSVMRGLSPATTHRSSITRTGQSEESVAIQRVVRAEHSVNDADAAAADTFCAALQIAVDKASNYVQHVPTLGKYADIDDGRISHWIETWESFTKTGQADLPHAAFGYAVEALATLVYLPNPPAGMLILLQHSRNTREGTTRPDIILARGIQDVAWIDITAENSKDHIYKKAGWTEQAHRAEVTYASVDLAVIANLAKITDPSTYKDNVDITELKIRLEFAKRIQQIRRNHWRYVGINAFPPPKLLRGARDPILRDQALQNATFKQASKYFGLSPLPDELKAAMPSILYAMGITATTRGFQQSVSRSRGEHYLQLYDPNLPAPPPLTSSIPPYIPPLPSTALVPVAPQNQPTYSLNLPDIGGEGAFPFAAFQGFSFNFDPSVLGNLPVSPGPRPQITSGAAVGVGRPTGSYGPRRGRDITKQIFRTIFAQPYYTRSDLDRLRGLRLPPGVKRIGAVLHDNQRNMFQAQLSQTGAFQFGPIQQPGLTSGPQALIPTLGASGLLTGPSLPPSREITPSTGGEPIYFFDALAFEMDDGSTVFVDRNVLNESEELEEMPH